MLNLLLLLSMTSIGLVVAVTVFFGLAWLVVAVPVVVLVGGGSGARVHCVAASWRRGLLCRLQTRQPSESASGAEGYGEAARRRVPPHSVGC